ncbi:MAG: peptidoglycan DD-metalloendopeptidase family protein, partial [Candidatus Omnitrophica bacterium]|nr:peptidoglycan DD-metalloendopeptidase family protein [Candidatus Omnitrophota bacterium]
TQAHIAWRDRATAFTRALRDFQHVRKSFAETEYLDVVPRELDQMLKEAETYALRFQTFNPERVIAEAQTADAARKALWHQGEAERVEAQLARFRRLMPEVTFSNVLNLLKTGGTVNVLSETAARFEVTFTFDGGQRRLEEKRHELGRQLAEVLAQQRQVELAHAVEGIYTQLANALERVKATDALARETTRTLQEQFRRYQEEQLAFADRPIDRALKDFQLAQEKHAAALNDVRALSLRFESLLRHLKDLGVQESQIQRTPTEARAPPTQPLPDAAEQNTRMIALEEQLQQVEQRLQEERRAEALGREPARLDALTPPVSRLAVATVLPGHPGIHLTPVTDGVDGRVRSAARGQVAYRGDVEGLGLTVIVDHGTFLTVYSHLKDVWVADGDLIEQGRILGRIDLESHDPEPFLHFEIRAPTGKPLDPKAHLRIDPSLLTSQPHVRPDDTYRAPGLQESLKVTTRAKTDALRQALEPAQLQEMLKRSRTVDELVAQVMGVVRRVDAGTFEEMQAALPLRLGAVLEPYAQAPGVVRLTDELRNGVLGRINTVDHTKPFQAEAVASALTAWLKTQPGTSALTEHELRAVKLALEQEMILVLKAEEAKRQEAERLAKERAAASKSFLDRLLDWALPWRWSVWQKLQNKFSPAPPLKAERRDLTLLGEAVVRFIEGALTQASRSRPRQVVPAHDQLQALQAQLVRAVDLHVAEPDPETIRGLLGKAKTQHEAVRMIVDPVAAHLTAPERQKLEQKAAAILEGFAGMRNDIATPPASPPRLTPAQQQVIRQQLRDTVTGILSVMSRMPSDLPPDKARVVVRGGKTVLDVDDKEFTKTTPANIAMTLWSLQGAMENGALESRAGQAAALKILNRLAQMKTYQDTGLFFRYYDAARQEAPRIRGDEVPTVDNGLLTMALAMLAEAHKGQPIGQQAKRLLASGRHARLRSPRHPVRPRSDGEDPAGKLPEHG